MVTTIDKAGRIVVPKALRERLGFEGGTEIEIEVTSDGLRIRALSPEPSFIRKEGVLVHHGSSPPLKLDIGDFANQVRHSRSIELLEPQE
jgi:AbrB family looped-hinge helix DNA binding protein